MRILKHSTAPQEPALGAPAQRTGAPKTMFECFGVGSSLDVQ